VPELWEVTAAAKLRAFGPADALDSLKAPAGVRAGRVAGDEVVWVGDPGRVGKLLDALQSQLAPLGNRAAVVDHSDGYALFSLTGPLREELFARLSSIRIPSAGGFVQGNFAGVPARIFCGAERLEVIVTSDVAWFVGGRLEHAGHDLAPATGGAS
jgi:sarcosine oxidase gamma subunit